MGDGTSIAWTNATWNVTTGCDRVSPGCGTETEGGCYAERMAARLQRLPAYADTVENGRWTGKINLVPERLDLPLRWKKSRRVFVDSMSDLFHPDVPEDFIAEVWTTMDLASQHQFQILTKRPQRMASVLSSMDYLTENEWPLPNVWCGASVESDRYAFRADHVRATPAAIRFLSLEPLLGPLPSLDLTGIDWAIVGAESGPNARPMEDDWVRDIRDRCLEAGTRFFFKQRADERGHKIQHPVLDGRVWEEYPV